MSDSGAWQALFPTFPDAQIRVALEILLDAGKGLQKRDAGEREDPLTERLHLQIRRNPRYRSENLLVQCHCSVFDANAEASARRGILDLRFSLQNAPKADPYFAVEAKRLRYTRPGGKRETGNRDYVIGRQGMRCFTEKRYAESLNAVAMLGYVFDGDIPAARNGISRLIGKHAVTLKCRTPAQLSSSELPLPEQNLAETRHDLDGSEFRIYHVFLSV